MKVIFSHLHNPYFNIAAEAYFFAHTHRDILFLYVNDPSIIIGSNQAVQNEVNTVFCRKHLIKIIRRISGGGAVYHDNGNLNYCFIKNCKQTKLPVNTDFLTPVIDVLHAMQIPVKMGKRKDLWLPDGYKISGTASHISRCRAMYHGTLLYDANLEHLRQALSPKKRENIIIKATPSVPSAVKNMRLFLSQQNLPSPLATDFFGDFSRRMLRYFNEPNFLQISDEEVVVIQTIAKEKYSQKTWNFRM